jgi:16S rRNA A1518/A1519 N6-dimethyltransferase RsmA/KsgA/DIM1 with predicted DNA glycosylase/AP lyase activity
LLQLGPPLVAIERDRRLVSVLAREFSGRVNFGLANMDATRLDWTRVARRSPVLVSNLPYPITSEILLELAQSPIPVRRPC